MIDSKLVVEMEVDDMLELRQLAGAVHQFKRTLPKLLRAMKKLDRSCVWHDDIEFMLSEVECLTTTRMNLLSSLTSYSKEEAKVYMEREKDKNIGVGYTEEYLGMEESGEFQVER
jgi:hypothetical protein